jgi:hypothetical protein
MLDLLIVEISLAATIPFDECNDISTAILRNYPSRDVWEPTKM